VNEPFGVAGMNLGQKAHLGIHGDGHTFPRAQAEASGLGHPEGPQSAAFRHLGPASLQHSIPSFGAPGPQRRARLPPIRADEQVAHGLQGRPFHASRLP
jgi:hypothetical protein